MPRSSFALNVPTRCLAEDWKSNPWQKLPEQAQLSRCPLSVDSQFTLPLDPDGDSSDDARLRANL